MRIKRLIIKNFRGLSGDENIIDFENCNIIFLIGKNNNGKSTFLHAYNFFVNTKVRAQISDFTNYDIKNKIEIVAEYRKEEGDEKSSISKEPDWMEKWVDSEGIIKIKKTWFDVDKEGEKETFSPKENKFVAGGFGGFDTLLTKYSPEAIFINAVSTPDDLEKSIEKIITDNHIKKLEKNHKQKYEDIIRGLEDLKKAIATSDDINQTNENMNKFFKEIFPKLELEIYSKPDEGVDITKTLKATHGLKVKEIEGTINYLESDFKNNGHGVMRQAFFSFLSTLNKDIDSTNKEYLILFEEPELFLHPEAIFSLREQLYKLSENSPFQILCATHSPLMIDVSKPHSSLVRLVKKEDKSTKTHQVNFDMFDAEEKNYIQMINRFNPHICESFYADEVILVEGDTEAIIYRDLISQYFSEKKDVFVLNTGSKSNMVFYQKILTHFGIKHIVVHDCDTEKVLDKNQKEKINSMWTANQSIWNEIINSNNKYEGISRRFIHLNNFEQAHNYEYNTNKGKPLSAYLFAQTINLDSKLPCVKLLMDIFGDEKINHDQNYIIQNCIK